MKAERTPAVLKFSCGFGTIALSSKRFVGRLTSSPEAVILFIPRKGSRGLLTAEIEVSSQEYYYVICQMEHDILHRAKVNMSLGRTKFF